MIEFLYKILRFFCCLAFCEGIMFFGVGGLYPMGSKSLHCSVGI